MQWTLPEDARLPYITRIKTEIDSAWDANNVEIELSTNRFADLATLQLLEAIKAKAKQQGLSCTFLGQSEAVKHQRSQLGL
jgi:anti-anti-sigma regulatory factor